MTKSFNCSSCSAPNEFNGSVMQKCSHFVSAVIAPHEMFYAANPAPFGDLTGLTGRALKFAEIQQLIHDGKKIEAIKVFREVFGTGLKESKDAVEAIERGESIDVRVCFHRYKPHLRRRLGRLSGSRPISRESCT